MSWKSLFLAGLTLAVAASSCRQVIGIEPAQADPSFGQHGPQSAAGAPTEAISTAGASATQGGSPSSAGGSTAGTASTTLGSTTSGGARASGAGGEAGGGADAGAGGDGTAPTLCQQYCQTVMANCSGAFAVYASLDACLNICAALPPGAPGDRGVNTVQCRLHAASVAQDEVPHYCPIAGPGGNGGCGANCESLCQLRQQICAGYAKGDATTCRASCAKLTDLDSYSTDLSAGQYAGPHVQCRLYHVSAAAVDDAEQHCLHVDGAAPCD